jgi:hypothetical protein
MANRLTSNIVFIIICGVLWNWTLRPFLYWIGETIDYLESPQRMNETAFQAAEFSFLVFHIVLVIGAFLFAVFTIADIKTYSPYSGYINEFEYYAIHWILAGMIYVFVLISAVRIFTMLMIDTYSSPYVELMTSGFLTVMVWVATVVFGFIMPDNVAASVTFVLLSIILFCATIAVPTWMWLEWRIRRKDQMPNNPTISIAVSGE